MPLDRILLIIPTRDRLWRLLESLSSIARTQTGLCDILIVWDGPDQRIVTIDSGPSSPQIMTRRNPVQLDMAPTYDKWARLWSPRYRCIGFGSDDFIFETPGWDRVLLDHLRSHPLAVMYGDDGLASENLCTTAWVDTDIIQGLGFASPPDLKHICFDNAWMAIGRGLGTIRYFPELKITHKHFQRDANLTDGSYLKSNSSFRIWQDTIVYDDFVTNRLPDLLRECFGVVPVDEWGGRDQLFKVEGEQVTEVMPVGSV